MGGFTDLMKPWGSWGLCKANTQDVVSQRPDEVRWSAGLGQKGSLKKIEQIQIYHQFYLDLTVLYLGSTISSPKYNILQLCWAWGGAALSSWRSGKQFIRGLSSRPRAMLGTGGSCWVMGIKPSIYGDMDFLWDYYGDLFLGLQLGYM